MPDVEIATITLPEGVSKSTHFIVVKGDKVVAIERTPEMLVKAKKTAATKAAKKKEAEKKRQAKAVEKQLRAEQRAAKKKAKENYQKEMAALKAQMAALKSRK